MTKHQTPEGESKSEILRGLTQLGVLHFRMNAGSNSKFMRGQKPGTADVLAAPQMSMTGTIASYRKPIFLWIEVKPKGWKEPKTLTATLKAQARFKEDVEARGHYHVRARSLADVLAKLHELGCTSSEDNPVLSKTDRSVWEIR